MKKIYLTFGFLLCAMLFVAAQTPQGINYQAVVRNSSGAIAANSAVTFRFGFLENSATGTLRYQETKAVTTDAYGMANVILGSGVVVSGTFAAIDWSKSNYLKVEVNLTGSYVNLGTTKFQSVPYALNAGGGGWTASGNNLYNSNSGNVGIGTNAPNRKLTVNATGAGIAQTNGTIEVATYIDGSNGSGSIGTISNHPFSLYANNSAAVLNVTTDGDIGINTLSTFENLTVNGPISSRRIVSQGLDWGGINFGTNNPTFYSKWSGIHSINTGGEDQGDLRFYTAYGTTQQRMSIASTGNVSVVNSLSKGGGSFKIDHPLDPENKFLYHSFVESPDMMNVYNGIATTDANGFATVEMPDYFEALNRDFRYQLTAVGGFAQICVKEKMANGKFVIQTSVPNQEVSWQVTGIRQDNWANQNRIPNTVEKDADEKGFYLHPAAFGKSEDLVLPSMRVPEDATEQAQPSEDR